MLMCATCVHVLPRSFPDQHQNSKMDLTIKTAEEIEEVLRSNGLKKVADVCKGMIFSIYFAL